MFACLSREQKDKIADCFTGLRICQDTVKVQAKADDQFWSTLGLSLAGGLLAGFVIGIELRK